MYNFIYILLLHHSRLYRAVMDSLCLRVLCGWSQYRMFPTNQATESCGLILLHTVSFESCDRLISLS
jgi:hypothetical protein